MDTPLYPGAVIQLTSEDSNAFAIMQRVKQALRAHLKETKGYGWDQVRPLWEEYFAEATSADYDHLLRTTLRWVSVR
jgi:hypothetical protein